MADIMTNADWLELAESAYNRIPILKKNRQQAAKWVKWLKENKTTSDAVRYRETAMLVIQMSY